MVKRTLNLLDLMGKRGSALLFGARGVGKSSLSREYLKSVKNHLGFDLLNFDSYTRYLKDPGLLRAEVEDRLKRVSTLVVWIDEIQKVPPLLDEVHAMIELHKTKLQFLMTGSSARKLRRSGANLLAGRALSLRLHPLTHAEADLRLDDCLRIGTLPGIALGNEQPELSLKSYIQTYLKEEIFEEALIRRMDAFSRFLEIAAQYHGEIINASEIGKAAGVSGQTVQQYFQILEDTLIGWRLPGWSASIRKQLRTAPKFLLFDNGVANALRGELQVELRESSSRFGKLFEAWVIQELFRLNDYMNWDFKFSYWRTNTDTEVDLIVSRGAGKPLAAIEIKSSKAPEEKHLHGLRAFAEDYPSAKSLVFCRTPRSFERSGIRIVPWEQMREEMRKL